MLEMGATAKDKITGFAGIVIGRIEYQNGCVQYQLQPTGMHEGKPLEAQWFDEQRLCADSKREVGGPGDRPPAFAKP